MTLEQGHTVRVIQIVNTLSFCNWLCPRTSASYHDLLHFSLLNEANELPPILNTQNICDINKKKKNTKKLLGPYLKAIMKMQIILHVLYISLLPINVPSCPAP